MKKINFYFGLSGLAIIALFVFIASSNVNSTRLVSNLTVYEDVVLPTFEAKLVHDDMNETVNYRDGLTRADVDHVWADTVSGAGTIDLTALTNSIGESFSMAGEILMAVKFKLEDIEGASVVIDSATTNSYNLFGAAYSFTLLANQSLLYYADTNLAVVSASAKNIDYDVSDATTMLSILIISADGYQ